MTFAVFFIFFLQTVSDSKVSKVPEQDWNFWVASNMGNILAVTSLTSKTVPREKISNSFRICIEQMTEGNIAAFARLIKFPKNQVWGWSNGKVIPQLDVLLKISYLMGLSLSYFLNQDDLKINYLFNNTKPADKR